MLPTSVSKFASFPKHPSSTPFIHRTARTFPVNGTFTPPQRELYAALLATQKALVKECAVSRGHSLESLHRRSVDVLRSELERIGLPCAGHHVLERILYPHYLAHPIGIGKFFGLWAPCARNFFWWFIDWVEGDYRLARVGDCGEERTVSIYMLFYSFVFAVFPTGH